MLQYVAPLHNEFLQSCAPESRDILGNSSPQRCAAMQCSLVNISWIVNPPSAIGLDPSPESFNWQKHHKTSNSEARTTSIGLSLFLCCAAAVQLDVMDWGSEAPARSGNTPQSDAASAPVITLTQKWRYYIYITERTVVSGRIHKFWGRKVSSE